MADEIDIDFNMFENIPGLDIDIDLGDKVEAQAYKRKQAIITRRAFSEKKLQEVLGPDLEAGTSYHVLSGGK